MNADDWALVVGIWRYPGFADLAGPKNDAVAFRDWLVAADGGGVPADHTELILSPDTPAAMTPTDAVPSMERVEQAFDRLLDVADANDARGQGRRIGRRLYLYFAGHGFAPEGEAVVFLAANATPARSGKHVAGPLFADYFRRAGLFDEVVLFMDCCRESCSRVRIRFPYENELDPDAPETGKSLIGYATKWSRKSREKLIDGTSRGVFTAALLAGLKAGAAQDDGAITDKSLAEYLYDRMKDFLTKAELEDPEVPKRPDILIDPDPAMRITLARVQPPRYPVEVAAGPAAGRLVVRNGTFAVVADSGGAAGPLVTLLPRGFYMAQLLPAGTTVQFEVPLSAQGGVTRVNF